MFNIPRYSGYNHEKKIALFDHSAIEFMFQLDYKGYKSDTLLQGYDVVFLPGWIVEEIQESSDISLISSCNPDAFLYLLSFPQKISDASIAPSRKPCANFAYFVILS